MFSYKNKKIIVLYKKVWSILFVSLSPYFLLTCFISWSICLYFQSTVHILLRTCKVSDVSKEDNINIYIRYRLIKDMKNYFNPIYNIKILSLNVILQYLFHSSAQLILLLFNANFNDKLLFFLIFFLYFL